MVAGGRFRTFAARVLPGEPRSGPVVSSQGWRRRTVPLGGVRRERPQRREKAILVCVVEELRTERRKDSPRFPARTCVHEPLTCLLECSIERAHILVAELVARGGHVK